MQCDVTFRLNRKLLEIALPEIAAMDPVVGSLPNPGVVVTVPQFSDAYNKIGTAESESLNSKNESLIFSLSMTRKYTKHDFENATAFLIDPKRSFYPVGEECGTKYSDGCIFCGIDRQVEGQLILDTRKIPNSVDIATTVANDEIVVSQRFAEILSDEGLKGFMLSPVVHKDSILQSVSLSETSSGVKLLALAKSHGIENPLSTEFALFINRSTNAPLFDEAVVEWNMKMNKLTRKPKLAQWYQLTVVNNNLRIDPRTELREMLFGTAKKGDSCPLGHILGMNRFSELYLANKMNPMLDIQQTSKAMGFRFNLGRPYRMIVINQHFLQIVQKHSVRGLAIEVAHEPV